MTYLNKVWMAASVAVVNGHTDQGFKFSSGIRSLHQANKRFSGSDFRPLAGMMEAGGGGGGGCGMAEKQQQVEDSLKQVMFLNSWGQG